MGYWVGMLHDITEYCENCSVCQASKQPSPQKAPLINIPVGKPWQMIAVDILQVPLSSQNNRYLLVIQDYFTKWVEAILLPDQTAKRITGELVKVFAKYGLPATLYSDLGRNFESSILQQTLEAFGIKKLRMTAYHPEGDGMVERLTALFYSYSAAIQNNRKNGNVTYHMYYLPTIQQYILQRGYLLLK